MSVRQRHFRNRQNLERPQVSFVGNTGRFSTDYPPPENDASKSYVPDRNSVLDNRLSSQKPTQLFIATAS